MYHVHALKADTTGFMVGDGGCDGEARKPYRGGGGYRRSSSAVAGRCSGCSSQCERSPRMISGELGSENVWIVRLCLGDPCA